MEGLDCRRKEEVNQQRGERRREEEGFRDTVEKVEVEEGKTGGEEEMNRQREEQKEGVSNLNEKETWIKKGKKSKISENGPWQKRNRKGEEKKE